MGKAVARQLSRKHEIVVGSRDPAKAIEAVKDVTGASVADYASAARGADVVIWSVPYPSLKASVGLVGRLAGKLAISMVNPLKREGGVLQMALQEGSAAEELAGLLPECRVATAFNNVPALMFEADEVPQMDILVAADSMKTFEEAAELVRTIPNLRPLYAGPLAQARVVEGLTPLVLNLAKLNRTGSLAPRFVSRKG
jgi:NADPH-dependent F420 reductase